MSVNFDYICKYPKNLLDFLAESMKKLLSIVLMLLCSFATKVAASDTLCVNSVEHRFKLFYSRNRIDIDEFYLDNPNQIAHVRRYLADSPRIDSIVVYAWASPEGVYEKNVWLSEKRAQAAKRFILENTPEGSALKEENIILKPMHENWEGLVEAVEQTYFRHDRDKVLNILRDTTIKNDTKKWRLSQLDNGYTYNYIIRHQMPQLRVAAWICVWAPTLAPLPEVNEPGDTLVAPVLPLEKAVNPVPIGQRTFMAAKTNLIMDAATIVNYSLEFPINEHFSFLYEQYCPWWLSKNNQYCLQFLSFGGEFRWWFSPKISAETSELKLRDSMVGHFVGVNGWGGMFDIQAKDFGCYQGEFLSFGLTYGYSMPVGKYLNMEFSISAGYAKIPYRHYNPTPDWQILVRDPLRSGTLHYLGPTKAEISLVLPIRAKAKYRGEQKR